MVRGYRGGSAGPRGPGSQPGRTGRHVLRAAAARAAAHAGARRLLDRGRRPAARPAVARGRRARGGDALENLAQAFLTPRAHRVDATHRTGTAARRWSMRCGGTAPTASSSARRAFATPRCWSSRCWWPRWMPSRCRTRSSNIPRIRGSSRSSGSRRAPSRIPSASGATHEQRQCAGIDRAKGAEHAPAEGTDRRATTTRCRRAREAGKRVVSTFVPGNFTELLRAFDVLPVLPEINALQSAMRKLPPTTSRRPRSTGTARMSAPTSSATSAC